MFDSGLTAERLFDILGPVSRTRVRRRRLVVTAVGAIVGLSVLAGQAGAGGPSGPAIGEHSYVVRRGDTLWRIAQTIVGPSGDPRPVVDALARSNHVRDGLIAPGERLQLP